METRQSILWGFHQAWRGWSCKHHGIWDTVVKAHLAGVSGSPRSSVRSVPPRRLFLKKNSRHQDSEIVNSQNCTKQIGWTSLKQQRSPHLTRTNQNTSGGTAHKGPIQGHKLRWTLKCTAVLPGHFLFGAYFFEWRWQIKCWQCTWLPWPGKRSLNCSRETLPGSAHVHPLGRPRRLKVHFRTFWLSHKR